MPQVRRRPATGSGRARVTHFAVTVPPLMEAAVGGTRLLQHLRGINIQEIQSAAPHLVTIDMSMAACRDALDNTSAQDKTCGWAAHCSEYLFISIENTDDLLISDHDFFSKNSTYKCI